MPLSIAILSESEASDQKNNRFNIKYGGKGKNIALDLLKEQFHKDLKTTWNAFAATLSEKIVPDRFLCPGDADSQLDVS